MTDPRVVLERLLAPEVVLAIEMLIDARVEEAVHEEQRLFGGKPWLTTVEAAQALGCTPVAVRMRHRRGRLVGRYQGSRLYISAQSIRDLGVPRTSRLGH